MRKGRRYRRKIINRTAMIVVLICTVSLVVVGAMGAVHEMDRVIAKESIPAQSKAEVKISSEKSESRLKSVSSSAVIDNNNKKQLHNSAPAKISSTPPKTNSKPQEVSSENYFDDAVFIGDSRTEGLRNFDGLGNATYYAVKGLMVNTAFTKPAVNLKGKKVSVTNALKEKKFGKVYVMLGLNELGWSSFQTFIQDYEKLIDEIKKDQPNSKIYIQSILPVSKEKAKSDSVFTNNNINRYNEEIKKLAQRKGANYLEVNKAVSDSDGNLPGDASNDGIHLNSIYCKKWCEYLKAHTTS